MKRLYIASLSFALAWGVSECYMSGQSTGNNAQPVVTGDSLTLSQIMQMVIQSHPTIKEAEEAIAEADAKIGLAKAAYLPNVDASASYSRIGPVPTIDFPGLGKFQLYPENNYSAGINYNQTVYDFGKTKKSVDVEIENKSLATKKVDLAKQGLSLLSATTFYNLVYLQEAIKIKDVELQALKEHLDLVEKKKATGSATQYEYLSTKVKISTKESEKLDLETLQKIQQSVLKSLIGLPAAAMPKVKQDFSSNSLTIAQDSLLNYAYAHRLEMDINKEKEAIAGFQYNLTKSQNNPSLSVFATGGGKNGYIPNLNEVKPNFVAGVSVKIPLFDGNRLKYNLSQKRSAINNASYDSEIAKRNITNEVIESEANRLAALQKIKQNELQVAQAEEAFALAKINYRTGSLSNVDLLDAENVVSESRLKLLKSKVDYLTSVFKLNVSLGNKMY